MCSANPDSGPAPAGRNPTPAAEASIRIERRAAPPYGPAPSPSGSTPSPSGSTPCSSTPSPTGPTTPSPPASAPSAPAATDANPTAAPVAATPVTAAAPAGDRLRGRECDGGADRRGECDHSERFA